MQTVRQFWRMALLKAKPEFDIDTSTGQHWRQGQGPAWEASRLGQGASGYGGARTWPVGCGLTRVRVGIGAGWLESPENYRRPTATEMHRLFETGFLTF